MFHRILNKITSNKIYCEKQKGYYWLETGRLVECRPSTEFSSSSLTFFFFGRLPFSRACSQALGQFSFWVCESKFKDLYQLVPIAYDLPPTYLHEILNHH